MSQDYDQPKPTTDCTCDIDTVCAVHGGPQPKPTTVEWTVERLKQTLDVGAAINLKYEHTVSEINAALAAEREKVQPLVDALTYISLHAESKLIRKKATDALAKVK